MARIKLIDNDLHYFGNDPTDYQKSEKAFAKWSLCKPVPEVKRVADLINGSTVFKSCFSPNFFKEFLNKLQESPTIF